MRVVVLLGGVSEERDVSLASGCQVADALRQSGHDVITFDPADGALTRADEAEILTMGVRSLPPAEIGDAGASGTAISTREEILDDVLDFWASREGRPREGRSGHVITGPIYIDGAERGDMLEIQILDIETRVSWGANSTRAQGGVFSTSYPGARADDPQLEMSPMRHLIRTGKANGREVAFFSDDIHVPLAPFMGILAVAPDPVVGEPGVMVPGVQGSRPPGAFGGNLDVKDLKAGTTVYLPVFHPGALFYAGDPHGAQGDGEVSGTAIEQSLSGVFRFIVHKGKTISGPRAETDTHYLIMGIDLDLNRATRRATWEVVDFLVHEKGLTPAKALSLASIAVDFRVSEVVDLTQVVTGFIPKDIFLR